MTGEELLAEITLAIKTEFTGLRYFHSRDSRRDEMRGFPDLVIVGPEGVLYRECKGVSEELRPDQVLWKWALKASGANWDVWRPADLSTNRVGMELSDLSGL